jgi:hypothetical protein
MVMVDLFLWLADFLVWYLRIPTVRGARSGRTFFLTHHHNHDMPDCRWAQRYRRAPHGIHGHGAVIPLPNTMTDMA